MEQEETRWIIGFRTFCLLKKRKIKDFFPPRQDRSHEAAAPIQPLLLTCSCWLGVAHKGNSKHPQTRNICALCLSKERSEFSGLSAQNLWFISSSKSFTSYPRAAAASEQWMVLQPGGHQPIPVPAEAFATLGIPALMVAEHPSGSAGHCNIWRP